MPWVSRYQSVSILITHAQSHTHPCTWGIPFTLMPSRGDGRQLLIYMKMCGKMWSRQQPSPQPASHSKRQRVCTESVFSHWMSSSPNLESLSPLHTQWCQCESAWGMSSINISAIYVIFQGMPSLLSFPNVCRCSSFHLPQNNIQAKKGDYLSYWHFSYRPSPSHPMMLAVEVMYLSVQMVFIDWLGFGLMQDDVIWLCFGVNHLIINVWGKSKRK